MPDDRTNLVDALLARLKRVYPDLKADRIAYVNGQFNHVLILNDELVFRFPRSAHAAAMLADEVRTLRAVRPYLSLAIPEPELGDAMGDDPFVGYRMIPGKSLQRAQVAAMADVELGRLADQLALFLVELHSVPGDVFGQDAPVRDSREHWAEMYRQIQEQLFPNMRADAQDEVRAHYEIYLSDPERLTFQPVVRHGDFGASNILWDAATQSVTGVIDFSFTGIGDPAIDAAAISTAGDALLGLMSDRYPDLATMLDRARFYRGTYALKEALDGLRDGDTEAFESGISQFR